MSIDLFWEKYIDSGDALPGRVGLLCNQTAFHLRRGEYLFQALARVGCLHRLFLPEHGLFAELQDQVPLDGAEIYQRLAPGVQFVSLYGSNEESLVVRSELLADLDTLIVDLQDVGSRYYTFATTVSYVFDVLQKQARALKVVVIERANPAGSWVEGTALPETYASFVGRPGLPHRHGLSLGELCRFYKEESGARVDLEIVGEGAPSAPADLATWAIPPSPNMPGPLTPLVYSGQCLLEGTNLNEGRGTTRPFEIFGAPYLDWIWDDARRRDCPHQAGAMLRPLQYIPTFHKFAGQVCHGFQLHVDPREAYHSLAHSLRLLRWIRESSGAHFAWRSEAYEFRSDRPAIEILAGDPVLLDYLRGSGGVTWGTVREHLAEGEEAWLRRARSVLGPGRVLRRVAV